MDLELVGLGSIVLDKIAFTPRIIGPEEKIALPAEGTAPFEDVAGGVTLNHLSWARLLGLRAGALGVSADDDAGRKLRSEMIRLGVEPLTIQGGVASAFSLIFVNGEGERAIYMYRGTNAQVTPEIVRGHFESALSEAKIFSTEVSQIPLDSVVEALSIARSAGVTTAIDVDIPLADALETLGTRQDFERALSLADIIKPTDVVLEEIAHGNDALERALDLRARYGAHTVAITLGAGGCAIADNAFEGVVEAVSVPNVIDTTGAGDAFFGGLLYGVARGLSGEALGQLANACGATCCGIVGAVPRGAQACLEAVMAGLPEELRSIVG